MQQDRVGASRHADGTFAIRLGNTEVSGLDGAAIKRLLVELEAVGGERSQVQGMTLGPMVEGRRTYYGRLRDMPKHWESRSYDQRFRTIDDLLGDPDHFVHYIVQAREPLA